MSQSGPRAFGALKGFGSGFLLPLRALRLLSTTRGLKRVALLPLLVTSFLYVALFALAIWGIASWTWTDVSWTFWGDAGAWVSSVVNALGEAAKWVILVPVLLAVCYFTFTVFGMVLASPINDILSERVELALCTEQVRQKHALRTTARATLQSTLSSLWIVLKQGGWSLLMLPFLLIPVVGVVPLFIVTAYYTAVGFMDTGMARNYFLNRHKAPGLHENRWALLGLGVAMELLFLVPFAGLLLMPLGVVGGTLLYCDTDWERLFAERGLEPPHAFVAPELKREVQAEVAGEADEGGELS